MSTSVTSGRLLFRLINPSKLFHLTERIFFQLIRYPCCSEQFIEHHVDLPGTPYDELQLYKSFSNKAPHLMSWMMTIFTIYAAKNFMYLYFTFNQVDFRDPVANLEQINETYYRFVCLETNCTKLSDSNVHFTLADDLLDLPIFSICNQQLKHLFSPIITSQTIGLLYMTEYTFGMFTLCVLYPIFVYATPITDNRTIMFTLCPIASVNDLRCQIRQHLVKLTLSELNYYKSKRHPLPDDDFDCRVALDRLERLEQVELDDELQEYIDDCLPINRTEWWRSSMLRAFTFLFVIQLSLWTFGFGVVSNVLLWHSVGIVYESTLQQLAVINTNQCVVRYSDSSVDLDQRHIRLDWNFYSAFEWIMTLALPIYISAVTSTNYFFICKDEKVCILELREQLKVALDFSIVLQQSRLGLGSLRGHKPPESFKLSPIRQRLIQSIGNYDWCLFLRTHKDRLQRPLRTKLDRKMDDQQFALELIEKSGPDVEVYCELLKKMLINFTQFTCFLEQNHQGIGNVLLFLGIINYGLSIIAVYFYRKFHGFVIAPVVLIIVTLIALNSMIALASDIHSSLKKLQTLVWTLISQDTLNSDIRVQALRDVCLRQMIFVEAAGGLGNRFMGFLISYVGILKMLVWTSTILTVLIR